MTKKLTSSIIDRIETENIKPRSKWYYRALYSGFWFVFASTLVLGALSFAVILYAITHTDFDISSYVDGGQLAHLMTLMPLVWALLVGLAIGLGIWGLRHTKRGYRLAIVSVFLGNLLGSVLLGTIVYGAGGGEMIEDIVEAKVPHYQSVREKHERFWGNPDKTGRLAGVVQSIDEGNQVVTVEGPRGRTWEISTNRLKHFDMEIEVGQPLKMRGTQEGQRGFMPEVMKGAHKQRRMHRKIQKRFERNPELRAKFEAALEPATREALQDAKENGERPSKDLRQKIRQEIKQNADPDLRMEILPPKPPRIYRGNEDSLNKPPRLR